MKKSVVRSERQPKGRIRGRPRCASYFAPPERSASQYGDRGRTLYALQDATIAAAYAQLAIVAAGLGSTWVGAFDEAKVREVLASSDLVPVSC
jgi:nitroreductase